MFLNSVFKNFLQQKPFRPYFPDDLRYSSHGQRVSKLLTGEDFREEVFIPAGDLHLASQTFFERMVLESRDGEAS